MIGRYRVGAIGACICFSTASDAFSQTPPVTFDVGACRLAQETVISPCRVAYRTYGRLDATKANAVLVPTWLLGRSEMWPKFLGPTGFIDTTRFFAIVVDALGNGHSASPSNAEPAAQSGFDALTIGDMVESQYRLVTGRFAITHLHAVVGISMGGLQAYEWAVRYPTFTSRVVSIAGSPRLGSFDGLLWTTVHAIVDQGIRDRQPVDSVWLQVLRVTALHARTPQATNQVSTDSLQRDIAAQVSYYGTAWSLADFRAQLGAVLRHDVAAPYQGSLATAAARVKARMLVAYSWDDHMVTAQPGVAFGRLAPSDSVVIASDCGHSFVFCGAERARTSAAVRAFLSR